MAFRRSATQVGRPLTRWLAQSGESSCTSNSLEALQVANGRAAAGLVGGARPFFSGRLAQADSAGAAASEATAAAFERAKSTPFNLYASIGGACGAAAGIYYLLFGGSKAPEVAAEAPVGVGTAHIGEYNVQTHSGSQFTPSELQDNFAIVYFGATTAVDCVSELEKLGEIIQQSDRKSNMHYLAPLFVTIDIDHDTEEKMKNVVELFNVNHNRKNVRLTGLTGPDTVKLHQAAVEYSGRSSPKPDQADNCFYVVDPDGNFIKAYPANASVAQISDELFEVIKKYKLNNPAWNAPKKVARRHA